MPLTIYRRHTKRCKAGRPEHDRQWKKCSCPIWVEGKLDQWVRESLKTENWQRASSRILEAEARGTWREPAFNEKGVSIRDLTIHEARRKFLDDAEFGRQVCEATLVKYRLMFRLLEEYCAKKGFRFVKEIDVDALREFRAAWRVAPRTALKRLERVKCFFRFAVESGWIAQSPATPLKAPEPKETQKRPFEPAEVDAILAECARRSDELLAFALLLRHSGLRIGDAAWLSIERLKGDELFLYTQKSGTHVYVPLPPFLVNMLRDIKPKHGRYFFAGVSLRAETVPELWRQKLSRVFKSVGIEDGHPHRFRHTFAIELLKAGVPMEEVSILLGHSSIRITERHYAAWVPARQNILRAHVEKTWTQFAAVAAEKTLRDRD